MCVMYEIMSIELSIYVSSPVSLRHSRSAGLVVRWYIEHSALPCFEVEYLELNGILVLFR